MESNSESGKVNLSETTYLARDEFSCAIEEMLM
jgi:hypothetical protein